MTTNTATHDIRDMKNELSEITKRMDTHLYCQLLLALSAPKNTVKNSCLIARKYFQDQLLDKSLNPWKTATCLIGLGYPDLAREFEAFAVTFNFKHDVSTPLKVKMPEIATLELLKCLKLGLSNEELGLIRDSTSTTFEAIRGYVGSEQTHSLIN